MWIIYSGAGLAVVAMLAFFVIQMLSSGETNAIKEALEDEKDRLEKLDFDQLNSLAEKEPLSEVSFDRCKFLRSLSNSITAHGPEKYLSVRLTLKGTKNGALEESSVITKEKQET